MMIPEIIYLQLFDDYGECLDPSENEVTWCSDQINESDIKYVLERIFDDATQRAEAAEAEVAWMKIELTQWPEKWRATSETYSNLLHDALEERNKLRESINQAIQVAAKLMELFAHAKEE